MYHFYSRPPNWERVLFVYNCVCAVFFFLNLQFIFNQSVCCINFTRLFGAENSIPPTNPHTAGYPR